MPSQWIQTLIDLPPLWDVLLKVSAVLAIGWGLHYLLLQHNPRWRALLWRAVAVGVLTIPLMVLILPALKVPVALTPIAATGGFEVVSPAIPLPVLSPVAPSQPAWLEVARRNPGVVAMLAWTLVTLLLAIRVIRASWRVRRIAKTSTVVPEQARVLLKQVATDLGCSCEVQLRQSKGMSSPFLCGLRRPLMILPERMSQADYEGELPAIFAHELAHLRGHDLWWMAAVQCLQTLLWFHPLAWRMRTAHGAACEEICDAVAAHYVGDGLSYSRTLSRVALERVATPPAVGGIPMARVSAIRHRLELLKRKVDASSLPLRWAIFSILIGSLVLAGVGGLKFVYAEEPNSSLPESVDGLDTIVPRLSVRNYDISEVLILLSKHSGLNFTVSKEVKGLVTAELSNVSVRDALDVVLKDNGWNYTVTPGEIVRVMTQEQYEREKSGSTSAPGTRSQWDLKGRSLKELDTVVPSIQVKNVDIKELLIRLSKHSGLNFTVSKGVKGPVTVELSNVSVRDALEVVLKDNGWDYIATPGGIVRVITREQYEKETNDANALLDQEVPLLDLRETDIKEVLSILGRIGGLNIIPEEDVEGTVTMSVRHKTLREVLDMLLPPNGYGYTLQGKNILVKKAPLSRRSEPVESVEERSGPAKNALISRHYKLDPESAKKTFRLIELDLYGEQGSPNPSAEDPRLLVLEPGTHILIIRDTADRIKQTENILDNQRLLERLRTRSEEEGQVPQE